MATAGYGLNSNQFVDIAIFNGQHPADKPKIVPLSFDFAAVSSYAIDFQNQQARAFFQQIQSMFVDNSANTKPLSIQFGYSKATIIVPPLSQGVFPVYAPNPVQMTVTSIGGVSANIFFGNMPQPYLVWAVTQTTPNFDGGGNLLVSDAALEATILNGRVQTLDGVRGSGDIVFSELVGTQAYTLALTATVNTNLIVGAPNWYATSIQIFGSTATVAATTPVDVIFRDSGAGVDIFTMSVALTTTATFFGQSAFDLDTLAGKANGNLQVRLGTALTGGAVRINVIGGTTATVV